MRFLSPIQLSESLTKKGGATLLLEKYSPAFYREWVISSKDAAVTYVIVPGVYLTPLLDSCQVLMHYFILKIIKKWP